MSKNITKPDDKLSMRERFSYGAGGMGNAIILAVVSTFLLFFYTDIIGLNAGIIGTIILVSKVFDGISDLVMGHIVDKTNSRHGKARCWILWLSIPYAISGVLLFTLSSSWPSIVQYIYVFVTYNLVNTIMFTGVCVPYNAMNCLITKNQFERGFLGTTNVFGNVIGQILVNTFMLKLVTLLGDNQLAWIMATAIFGVIGIIMHIICFTQTLERSDPGEKESDPGFLISVRSLLKNKYWLCIAAIATTQFFMAGIAMSSTTYFANIILNDIDTVSGLSNSMNMAQIVVYFLALGIMKKLGKGGNYRLGFGIAVISYILQIFAGTNYLFLIVCGVIRGIGIGTASACLGGMISDTIEYGEWKTGVRCVGVGNAANTFSQKIGSGVGSALVGWLLSAAGYSGNMSAISTEVIMAVNICYTYIPLICCIIIFLLALYYRLDKEYPQIIQELKERHTAGKQLN